MAGVSTEHSLYSKRAKQWQLIRDCIEGEDAVKAKGEVYLPKTKEPQNLKYRKRFIVYIIMTIVGGVVALFAEFLMLYFTHGNALG